MRIETVLCRDLGRPRRLRVSLDIPVLLRKDSDIVKHLLDIVPYKDCFDGKPVAMVGVAAGDFGAVRTLDHLASIFAYRNLALPT